MYKKVKDVCLVLIGCILFAFGDAVFLNKWDIVSGGVSSVGVIVDFLLNLFWALVFVISWLLLFKLLFGFRLVLIRKEIFY